MGSKPGSSRGSPESLLDLLGPNMAARGVSGAHPPLPPDLKATEEEMTVAVQMTASDHREMADSPWAPEIETFSEPTLWGPPPQPGKPT